MAEVEKVQKTVEETSSDKKEKPKKTLGQEIIEWVVTLAIALVIAIVVRTYFFEPVRVDGNSMYPTLKHGEIMIVSKMDYQFGGEPERFDVVICHYPGRGNTNFVKRIVGLPGDTVELREGHLIVNGVIYAEKFLHERPTETFGPITVPEGQYFVMGDNRNNSNDSRRSEVGPLDREYIVGKVSAVLWHTIPSTLEDYGLATHD
ncbi:MAG: signal peptidase I [Christensenellaceae bacterium]|nr:signal peptidase I [Christensenellaceae bacterium]